MSRSTEAKPAEPAVTQANEAILRPLSHRGPCACSTRASPAWRSPNGWRCPRPGSGPGTPTATTAPSATTPRLQADALEQLGYGGENGTWRSFFLMGAHELRNGPVGTPTVTASPDVLAALTLDQFEHQQG